MKKLKQSLSLLISYTLTFMPLHAASIQTDGTTNTTIEKARNDVPVVNIANPNAKGLSHNKFREYNVQKQGLILNNSKDTTVNTQLGGYIFGNKNLTSNAKVILNEVTSSSRTRLNGYTEVAGQRADLVIANPNGLSINGAGFINTSSVTFSTGTPIINGGNLDSFNIIGGDISIQGDGLDAMGPDSTYIYTHFLKLNAQIHANNLDIKLGKNSIDYNTKHITASTNSNEVALLLDSSALGGMYANRISLVGTDRGLGVNLPPEVLASTGEIIITNDGNIKLQKLSAKTNIDIDAKTSDINIEDTITAGTDINLKAKDITNNALVHTTNDLTITSDNLTNNKTLVSENDMFLYTKETLLNSEDANIFAFKNLTMAADSSNAKTKLITNYKANIFTLDGDINIYAESLENIIDEPAVTGYYNASNQSIINGENVSNDTTIVNCGSWCSDIINIRVDRVNLDGESKASSITSGKDINIYADSITNRYSLIAANGDIYLSSTVVDNQEIQIAEVTTKSVAKYRKDKYCKGKVSLPFGGSYCYRYGYRSTYRGTSTYKTVTVIKKISSTIQAGKDISGDVTNLNNANIKSNQVIPSSTSISEDEESTTYTNTNDNTPIISIPKDKQGLFVKNINPLSEFLIETNPLFSVYKNFISSDYMMSHIDYDAEATTKRVGDAFYENTLVSDSIFAQTGKRFLSSNIKSDNDQFKYLMDNAISARKALELSPGISLSKAQVNALTQDIVWMEEQVVAGQKVLVPVVYIANIDNFKLQGSQIIAGDSLNLKVTTLKNSGTLESGDSLNIEASSNITNIDGTIKADEDITLQATNDISNTSATIKAKNIDLTSTDGNIINKRYAKNVSYSRLGGKDNKVLIGNASNIQATNSLNMNAKEKIIIQGSELNAKDINLNASAVDITTTVDKKDFFGGNSKNYIKEKSTTLLASNINADNKVNGEAREGALGYININAVNTASIKGSNLNATSNLNVKAKKIDVLAVNNSTYNESKESSEGFFSSSQTTTKRATSTNIATSLDGANINLTTTKDDIAVIGSNLEAKDRLALDSAKDINIKAGYDGSMNESHTKKSGFFTGGNIYSESEDLEGKLTKTAKNSTLSASDINLNSKNSLNIKGSNLEATNSIEAQAKDINIQHALNEEKTYSKHTKLSVGLGDVVETITRPQDMVEFKDGKFSATLATATYDAQTKSTNKTTVASSTLDATNISLNASSTDANSGNILIQGSNLKAKEDIDLVATNDVTIKEAKETTDHESKEVHGKAELKVTLKNEYAQIAYALLAVKDATKALSDSKDNYDKYKDNLSKQKTKFAKLKQEYKNRVGFIELADVEEFEELLDDLKEDDSYYKANIVLATATLATKTTALLAQGAKAASSSGTYGFNAGLELDIDAIEKQLKEYEERSIASNLQANNINIDANNKASIQGSNLKAKEEININASVTDIVASKDMSNSKTNTEHKNINLSIDMYGGPSASVSADSSKSSSEQTKYTNSNLQANNININTKDKVNGEAREGTLGWTTTIKGANLKAKDTLTLKTKNLEVASVQDSSKTRSHSIGISAGFGGSGLSSLGANQSNANSKSKQTVLTSLTANKVDINTDKETKLKGATISAQNKDGRDNGNLNLKTKTLIASSLNNRTNSNSKSLGINIGGSVKENTASNVSLDYSNDKTNSKTKTLATLGSGNIQIGNKEDSDTKMLNTDIENNEVDIYNISSHKGLKGELDARLLTKDGRNKIKEDLLITSMIANTVKLIATTEKVEITDFFNETDKSLKTYQAVKEKVATSPELAKVLNDNNLTPAQKEQMLNEVTDAVMIKLGYTTHDNKIMSTDATGKDNQQVKGYYSNETQDAYINDKYNSSTKELISTAGHEATHAMDRQDNMKSDETYSNNYGDNLANYTNFALNINNQGSLATTNSHNNGQVTTTPSIFNTIDRNNAEFAGLDKGKGDNYSVNGAQAYGTEFNKKILNSQQKVIGTTGNYTLTLHKDKNGKEIGYTAYNSETKKTITMQPEELDTFISNEKNNPTLNKIVENTPNYEHEILNAVNGRYYSPTDTNIPNIISELPILLGVKDPQHIALKVLTPSSNEYKENPDKYMPIQDMISFSNLSAKDQKNLKSKNLYVSKESVKITKENASFQNATNGLLNTKAEAIKNLLPQTFKKDDSNINFTLNYNPSRGIVADLLESSVDQWGGTTGIAKQTGEFTRDVTTARGKSGSNFVNHSQANYIFNSGVKYIDNKGDYEDGGYKPNTYFLDMTQIDKEARESGLPKVKGNGSPLPYKEMDTTLRKTELFDFTGMTTKKTDSVGELIGGNTGRSEQISTSDRMKSILYVPKLFGNESAHTIYPCDPSKGDICGDRP